MASKEHQPEINSDFKKQMEQDFPSIQEQAKNATDLLANQVLDLLDSGKLFTEDFEKHRRLDICVACPHYTPIRKRCKACGCFLEHKVKFTASTCPIGKW